MHKVRGSNRLGGFPVDVPAPWRDRQGDSWKMMDCDTGAVCLTAVGVSVCGGGRLRGTYQLHRHRVLEKFRNNWCDMIMGSYYIKSMSLAPVCLPLPRNAALRVWPWIMYLMHLNLEAAARQSAHTSVCVLQSYGWRPGPYIWPCFPNIVRLIIVTICW